MNVVLTSELELVEVQGTGEGKTFSRKELDVILELSEKTAPTIFAAQDKALLEYLKLKA